MTAPDLISLTRSLPRKLFLPISLRLGYRRQRIARLIRSADVKRGLAKSRMNDAFKGERL